jgi:hypothetical protein
MYRKDKNAFYSRFYRLNSQREFGDIFSVNKGCSDLQAGIGNIAFVKDLLTQSVLTNNFKCSKFGPHTHDMLGWVTANFKNIVYICNLAKKCYMEICFWYFYCTGISIAQHLYAF